jgi:hypothetical protein
MNAQSNVGLIANWRFSNNVADSAGTHHGTANNITYTTGRKGLPNTAAVFNGTSSYISVPYQSDMNVTEYSICATVKPSAFYTASCQTNSILWRGPQNASDFYALYFYDNAYDHDCSIIDTSRNVFASPCGPNTGDENKWKYSPNVFTNTWYSVVATYKNDTVRIYVDGVKKSTYNLTPTSLGSGTDGLYIGANYNGTAGSYPYWFKGIMDDIRLYSRQLADTEVQQYYSEAYLTAPIPTVLCKTVPYNLSYAILGSFNTGNVFSVQLSDATGSFASPTTIGSLTSTAASSVTCTVPSGVPLGTGFKIRLVSSSPAKIGDEYSVTIGLPTTPPTISISVAPSTAVINGGTTFFSAIPGNAGTMPTYQWRKNRNPIPGANSITYSAIAGTDYTTADTIDCVVHSNTICAIPDSAVSNDKVMYVFSVGIDGIENTNSFSIYPNPNKGSFTIKGVVNGNTPVGIEILNTLGQVIYNDMAPVQNGLIEKQITLTTSAMGIYYLRLQSSEEKRNFKITIH